MATSRIDLTQPLPEIDLEDEWLDDDEGSWEEPQAESEPEPEPERPRRNRRSKAESSDRKSNQKQEPRKSLLGRKSDKEREPHKAEPEQQPAPKQPAGQTSALTDLVLLLFKVGLVIVFLLILFTFFYGITQARDTSMSPAVKEGDIVIYYRPDKDYTAGDAIVVEYNGSLQVRRVVAVAGDTVDISSSGGLIINGSTQIETNIYTTTYPYTEGITFPVTVGEGEVFVLGDDRTNAIDSRVYGTVSVDAAKGSVMTVIRRRGF